MITKYRLFENIQQGKSILSSVNKNVDDPSWLRLLKIFERNPGYIGNFAYLIFKKNWSILNIEFIYNQFINSQSNRSLFNQIYPDIRDYKEETFIDKLMKLRKEKLIKDTLNKFPSEQKEIINKYAKKDEVIYNLSLRKDMDSFIRKISRYHNQKDLITALDLFLSSESSVNHEKIIKKATELKADIIKNDSANNLIILRVNYPQLRQLGAHTSWCILSQGTFDSYNSICDQYMIYFTDKIGNESLIGSTIGKSVKTSHYVNDNSVDRSTLEKLLSEREFKISDLYMSESEYIKREFQKSTLGELVKKYGKDKVYTERKIYKPDDFVKIDQEDVIKYDLKLDNRIVYYNTEKMKDFFRKGQVVFINSNVVMLYDEFGMDILPFMDPQFSCDKFNISIIELVEKIQNVKFTDYKDIYDRCGIDERVIQFLADRDIEVSDEQIANHLIQKAKENYSDRNRYDKILLVRPQLFQYLIDRIKYQDSKEIKKLTAIEGIDQEIVTKLIYDSEASENAKYVRSIVPMPNYSNMGLGRKEHTNFLKENKVRSFGPAEFMSDDIWGRIIKYKLYNSYRNPYTLYAFMSCAKLGRIEELKSVFPKLRYEDIGHIIRTAMYREGSKFGYFYNGSPYVSYNGSPYVSKDFYLNDSEQEKLFRWMLSNYQSDELSNGVSNQIYDKVLFRHNAFSLIYYIYGWGFERYFDIVSKVTPKKEDKWVSINDDEFEKLNKGNFRIPSGQVTGNVVERNLSRPDLFKNVLNYLATMNDTEEFYNLCEKIINMKLKLYEASRLVYSCVGYRSDIKKADLHSKLKSMFAKTGINMKTTHNIYDSGYDLNMSYFSDKNAT